MPRKPAPGDADHPLQRAADAAVAAGDVNALQGLAAGLPKDAPDAERRCVAYAFLRLAQKASDERRFADAHALVRAAGVARGRADAVVSILAGNVSLAEGMGRSDDQREALLAQAARSFESAHRLAPGHVVALTNWAAALAAQSKREPRARADRLRALACEKLATAAAAAAEGDPARPGVWRQWGMLLCARADDAREGAAEPLYEEACAKFAEAAKGGARVDGVHLLWGHALLCRARGRAGAEAAALFDEAAERFRAEAKARPRAAGKGNAPLLRMWGQALAGRAACGDPADADRFRAQAVQKWDAAVEADPNDVASLRLAGQTLLARAAARKGVRAAEAAEAALERLRRAATFDDRHEATLLAVARAQAALGATKRCVGALELWAAAAKKPSRKDLDRWPEFAALADDEAFTAFRRSVGRRA